MKGAEQVLEVREVTKSFGGVRALQGVSFSLARGAVLGLVGDNGAGKSTLIKCISGMHRPDSGEIIVDGVSRVMDSPHEARELGIETVYQDLSLIETFNVSANLFLNREVYRRGRLGVWLRWLDKKRMASDTKDTLERLRITIPSLKESVENLSGGQRQAIAVARAVAWGRHIVLMDEPAAALGVEQSELVLNLIEHLAAEGIAVVLISHNMEHVLRVTHRVLVLRHGKEVADVPTAETSTGDLIAFITGARGSAVVPSLPQG